MYFNQNKRSISSEKKAAHGSQSCTFLHSLIVDFHVHHGRCAVPQDFPVSTVLLVTGSYLVRSLVRPPQLVSYGTQHTTGWSTLQWNQMLTLEGNIGLEQHSETQTQICNMVKLSYVGPEHTSLAEMNIFWRHTHDGQSSSLGQLALDPLEHLQAGAVQFAAVDGAVS